MSILPLTGEFATDTRPPRSTSPRKLWAQDPSGPEANNGTRIDATFINDFLGLLRALISSAGTEAQDGDDTALYSAILAIANARAAAALDAATDLINALNVASKVDKAGDEMSGPLILSGDGTDPLHPVSKRQLDAATHRLDGKESCRSRTTGNVDLSSGLASGTVHDGVTAIAGDRVLVAAQTAAAENGIYIVPVTGAASRAVDMDDWSEVPGAFVAVEEGTTYADTTWLCTSNRGGTLGASSVAWIQATSPAAGVASFAGRNGSVTPANDDYAATMLQAIAANSILGNNTGAAARPIVLTAAQVKALLAIAASDVSGLGTAATVNTGTSANQIPKLDGSGRLPAVDGSQLTNLNAGGLVLLNSGVVSSAAALDIVLSSYSGYRGYKFVLSGIQPATDDVSLMARFSTDGGATFDAGASNYAYAGSSIHVSGTNDTFSSTGDTKIFLNRDSGDNRWGNDAQYAGALIIELLNPSATGFYSHIFFSGWHFSTGALHRFDTGGGYRAASQDTDAIRFLFSSGNIAAMKWAIYGYK